MPERLNAWQVLDQTWRSAISALWRLPLLVLVCWLGDVLLSSYAFRLLPVAAANNMPGRIFDQAAYIGLHTLFAAPLMTAVVLMVIDGHVGKFDLWSKSTGLVGTFQLGRGLLYLILLVPFWFWSFHEPNVMFAVYRRGSVWLAFAIFYVSRHLWYFLAMLVWARIALMLPLAALSDGSAKTVIAKGWRAMKGHYGFAFAATIMAILPYLVLENIVDTNIYRPLSDPSVIPVGLTLHKWEQLMIRSGEVMLRCLIDSALAAWLYRAILARSEKREGMGQSTGVPGASPASLSG